MTTTATPSADQLQAHMAEARERVEAAEAKLGAAAIDRRGETAAEKEFQAATGEVQRVEAAINVATQRADAAAQQAADDAEQQARVSAYEAAVARLTAFERIIATITELKADISDLAAMPSVPTRGDVDHPLLRAMPPRYAVNRAHTATDVLKEMADFDRGAELPALIAHAKDLLAAERAGTGIAVTEQAWRAEQTAQRQARRDEREAREAREKEERRERAASLPQPDRFRPRYVG